MEKMQLLIRVYYQLYNNKADYLKTFQTSLIFPDLNFNEIYNMTTSILDLILQILSSRKLADL